MAIHPTAIIDSEAQIDPSTEIGPYVIIEGNVKIGKNNKILPGAFIGRHTTIGDNNEIHMGAVVGHVTQDRAFEGGESYLVVGDNNVIREHASIHRGTEEGSSTIIGNHCLIMGSTHIAHDCVLGDGVIMANCSAIAGYVKVGEKAILSGGSMVHQFVEIGRLAMLSGNSGASMDIPPFTIAAERNLIWSINIIGLRRAQFPRETISELRRMFKIFSEPGLRSEAIENIEKEQFNSPEVREFVEFARNSQRGICPCARHRQNENID